MGGCAGNRSDARRLQTPGISPNVESLDATPLTPLPPPAEASVTGFAGVGGESALGFLIEIKVQLLRHPILLRKPSAGAEHLRLHILPFADRKHPDHKVGGPEVVEGPIGIAPDPDVHRRPPDILVVDLNPCPRLTGLDLHPVGDGPLWTTLDVVVRAGGRGAPCDGGQEGEEQKRTAAGFHFSNLMGCRVEVDLRLPRTSPQTLHHQSPPLSRLHAPAREVAAQGRQWGRV